MPPDATVWVVDDEAAMRNSLKWLIESIGFAVRAYASAEEFLRAYDASVPGCIVSDVRMPGMSGIELQAELARRGGAVPMIFLTAHGEIPMAVRAIQDGAFDFIEKPFSNHGLLERIQRAVARERQTRVSVERRKDVRERLERLSTREREVLDQIVQGKANKEIASQLNVSVKTVEFHRAHVMQKMGAYSVASLLHAILSAREPERA
jgi:RNA polymerase sigma factor (sigma-70 family)